MQRLQSGTERFDFRAESCEQGIGFVQRLPCRIGFAAMAMDLRACQCGAQLQGNGQGDGVFRNEGSK